jgi:hypothetical protein
MLGHAYAIYRPLAMLAGMKLDVFTPLTSVPMTPGGRQRPPSA